MKLSQIKSKQRVKEHAEAEARLKELDNSYKETGEF